MNEFNIQSLEHTSGNVLIPVANLAVCTCHLATIIPECQSVSCLGL